MTPQTLLEELELSPRSYHCLKRSGVHNVKDLLSKTTDDFMQMRNMGRKSLHEIELKIDEVRGFLHE